MKEGWEYKKLGEVCTKGSSNISLNKIEANTGEYALYGASGYVKGIDFYHQKELYIGVVKDGAGVGRVNIYPPYSSLVGTMQYIFPNDCCNIGFLKYLLEGMHLDKFKTGATIPHIYFKDYGSCKVRIPPISKQQEIVSELDLLSAIIEKQKAQLEELDKLAQSIFYDMFGDPVTNEKGWETKELSSVAPQKGFEGKVPDKGGKYWILNLDMIKAQTGDIIEKCYFTKDEIGNSTIIFDNKNVLYSKLRPYLNKVVIPQSAGFGTSELIPLKPLENVMNRCFLAYLLRSKQFVSFINIKVQGAKMPRVSMNVLREFPTILPPLSLQQEFAEKIEAIEAMKAKVRQSLKEAETLFNSRMDYYFQ